MPPENDAPHSCWAELFFAEPVELDGQQILEALQAVRPQTEFLMNEASGVGLVFPDCPVIYTDGTVPAQHVITPHRALETDDLAHLEPALQQSWGWPEARDTLASCTHSLILMDMMSSGLERDKRLPLFHGTLAVLAKMLPCRAIYRKNSEQFIAPEEFLRSQEAETDNDAFDPTFGAFNVRFFRVGDGVPDESVMDTLGLSVFGLPDYQCHFAGLDENAIADLLYGLANYTFQEGDVIQDGHTVEGLEGQPYACYREVSLIKPERDVVDVDTGSTNE